VLAQFELFGSSTPVRRPHPQDLEYFRTEKAIVGVDPQVLQGYPKPPPRPAAGIDPRQLRVETKPTSLGAVRCHVAFAGVAARLLLYARGLLATLLLRCWAVAVRHFICVLVCLTVTFDTTYLKAALLRMLLRGVLLLRAAHMAFSIARWARTAPCIRYSDHDHDVSYSIRYSP
jgi:hypothetical protein